MAEISHEEWQAADGYVDPVDRSYDNDQSLTESIDYSGDTNYTQNELFHYLGGTQQNTYDALTELFTKTGADSWDSGKGLLDSKGNVVEGLEDDTKEGSFIQQALGKISGFWGGLGDQSKAIVLGMGMKGIEGMMTYKDKRDLMKAKSKSDSSQSAYYDAKTAELKAQQANQAGIGNMKWGGGLISQPKYQQVTINRPKVGG